MRANEPLKLKDTASFSFYVRKSNKTAGQSQSFFPDRFAGEDGKPEKGKAYVTPWHLSKKC